MASVGGEVVSATRIREHLARGDVGRAGELLGRPYDVVGRPAGPAPPCLIRIAPTRAVPAPGRYRASIGPFRPGERRTTAVVTVHPPGKDSTAWGWNGRRAAYRTERPAAASA